MDGVWAVEAWRGVAALMVLATHWAPALGGHNLLTAFGFVGVNLFFVISGYVFAPHILRAPGQRLGAYAVRRFMRIYPAYLVALALYAGHKAMQGEPLLYLGEHLLMLHVQSREMAFYYSPPFWSLPAEVCFYALVPLLGWMHQRPWARAGWIAVVAGTLGLRALCLWAADEKLQNAAYVTLHHLPTLLIEFLMGTWAWQVAQRRAASQGDTPRWGWVAMGLLGFIAAMLTYQALQNTRGHDWRHGQLGFVAAASMACLLVASAAWRPKSRRAQQLGDWAGRLSYGLYLLHPLWGFAVVACAPAWGPVAAGVAGGAGLLISSWALHRLVEAPARAWGRRWSQRED